jgi:hypothetical protein
MEIPRATPQVPGEVIRKEVKEVRVIEVSKQLYRTVESFIASSNKEGYFWNTGFKLGNTVEFVKPGKWVLTVSLYPEIMLDQTYLSCPIELRSLLGNVKVAICFGYYFRYENYGISDVKAVMEIDDINLHENFEFSIAYEWDSSLRTVAVYNKDVPYSYPILLFDIIDRINDFVNLSAYYETIRNAVFEKERELKAEQQAKTA